MLGKKVASRLIGKVGYVGIQLPIVCGVVEYTFCVSGLSM